MKKIGSGDDTMFWLDRWIIKSTLKTSFPKAYKLECHKHYKISDRLQNGVINWEWKSTPRTMDQISEINTLATTVCDFQAMPGRDKWVFTISSDGIFHIDVLRMKIDRWNMPSFETLLKWIHEIPLKVTYFMWWENLDRIPTTCALLKRGIQLASPLCTYCEKDDEDASHVILRCAMYGNWCSVGVTFPMYSLTLWRNC